MIKDDEIVNLTLTGKQVNIVRGCINSTLDRIPSFFLQIDEISRPLSLNYVGIDKDVYDAIENKRKEIDGILKMIEKIISYEQEEE